MMTRSIEDHERRDGMTTIPWMENDDLFADELTKGHSWQLYVALRLLKEGIVVQASRLELWRTENGEVGRPPIEDFTKTDVDLLLGRDSPVPTEVKSRSLRFTSPEDFPYSTFIVGTVASWADTEIPPEIVLYVSQPTQVILALNVASSRETWTIAPSEDTKRGITSQCYFCEKRHLRTFDRLVEWLHAH